MKKKEVIKTLLKVYGLNPSGIESHKTKNGKAWRGKGIDEDNEVVISFDEAGSLKHVLADIITQAEKAELSPSILA